MRNPIVRATGAAALLVLAAACGGGSRRTQPAATPARTGPAPTPVPAPQIFGLFGQREELGLTSEQINRLEGIATTLRERNDSLETQLRRSEMNRGRPRSMGEQRRRFEEALPSLEVIWANNRRATDEVGQVLTLEQRQQVCTRQRERLAGRNPPVINPDARRPMTPIEADSVLTRQVRGWTWCATTPARPAAATPGATGTTAPRPTPTPSPTPTPAPAPTPTPAPTMAPAPTPAPSPTPTPQGTH